MKLRRIARFHGLKRPRVRQTWNKYNLYNLARMRVPFLNNKTFFQQKWWAKAITRGYHGEHIKERKWERMFSRRLISAVDMDPAYLAKHDGSELASGRGSGATTAPKAERKGRGEKKAVAAITPYMQMIYAPMERRLDQAVFRALFASSARQARQFCVHGAVKVNGVKMKYPGYLLNPGDLFQVDIEKVMYATGMKKEHITEAPVEEAEEAASEPAAPKEIDAAADEAAKHNETAKHHDKMKSLKQLRKQAENALKAASSDLSAKRKIALRAMMKDVKTTWAKVAGPGSNPQGPEQIAEQLTKLLSELDITPAADKYKDAPKEEQPAEMGTKEAVEIEQGGGLQTKQERAILKRLIQEELENPHDPSKPYATPWQPRPYMSAFAFIPRYLEVNQNICAAVYLRHPVARQGLAEVPTPFPSGINQLAFNWYLRRG
ncbi:mitochondrial 37S ribosomal protein nam9 [Rhypophila decipiens]|uniref:Small ribosomal subunit protein uS4m n=1 Tax=Rhypophila decipiens TaxID=261697 RepID=A0AAN6Y0L7_9PEZI|nr:mitochondrial 37S ribosomal protein nam9 [Rhypophila decipiens]